MTSFERTGWRDLELSERHRRWGFNCPAVDLDFLMVEYNLGLPVALVEYKRHTGRMPDLLHPTYRALASLADATDLSFLLAFYWPDIWAFRVFPVNGKAKRVYGPGVTLTERRFVESLYYMRELKVEEHVLDRCQNELPRQSDREIAGMVTA